MVEADGELVGARADFGGSGVGARAVGTLRFVGKRILREDRLNRGIHGNRERVAGKCSGINSLPFHCGGDGKNLCCPEDLAESLVFGEIQGAIATVVNFGEDDWAAIGETKFVANERRNARLIGDAFVIEKIAGIERRVTEKLEHATVDIVGA